MTSQEKCFSSPLNEGDLICAQSERKIKVIVEKNIWKMLLLGIVVVIYISQDNLSKSNS